MKSKLSKELLKLTKTHKPITFLVLAKNKKQFDAIFNPSIRLIADNYRYVFSAVHLEGWRVHEPGLGLIFLDDCWDNPAYRTEEFQNAYRRFVTTV